MDERRYHVFHIELKHTVLIGPKDYIEGYLATCNKGCGVPKFAMEVYTGTEKPPRHPSVGAMSTHKFREDNILDEPVVSLLTTKEKVALYLKKN